VIGTKTVRRGLAVVAAAAVLAMPMGLAPAFAEPDYPPSFYKISAEAFNARVGDHLKFSAQTFQSGAKVAVDVSVDGSSVGSASATANAKGVATTEVTFTTTGVNRVTMSGTSDKGDPLSLHADVTVTAADEVVNPVDNNGGSGNSGDNQANAAGTNASGSDGSGIPFFGGGLPRTGGDIAATVLIAAALVGLGALLVAFTRRRRTS
jgi:2',3'-cyclic-nucleotide 2'-phosphodiesterase/3'-nucleotidase